MIFIAFPKRRRKKQPRDVRRMLYAMAGELPTGVEKRIVKMRMAQFGRLTGEFNETKEGAKLKTAMESGIKDIEKINEGLLAKGISAKGAKAKEKRRVLEAWKREAEYAEALIAFMKKSGGFPGLIEPGERRLEGLKEGVAYYITILY